MKARHEDGFTLLEILIGLSISALIMLGLSSAMLQVNQAWKQSTALGEQQAMLATGLRVVAGDLSHVERMFDKAEKPANFLFSGATHDMIFPIVERDGHNDKGIFLVRLTVRDAGGGTVELVRARAAYRPGPVDLAGITWRDEVVLARGPFDISFSYLTSAAASSWSLAWPLQNSLPRQIRIDVAEQQGRKVVLPPFIVALRMQAELACVEDDNRLCTLPNKGVLKPPVEGEPQ